MAADGGGAPEWTHLSCTGSVYLPWGTRRAREVPSSKKDTYPLTVLYKAPRQWELSMLAGGMPTGREKRFMKLSWQEGRAWAQGYVNTLCILGREEKPGTDPSVGGHRQGCSYQPWPPIWNTRRKQKHTDAKCPTCGQECWLQGCILM